MADTCEWVVNIRWELCGRPAVAVIHPPAPLPDDPLPVCAGHLDEHKRWGDHTEEEARA